MQSRSVMLHCGVPLGQGAGRGGRSFTCSLRVRNGVHVPWSMRTYPTCLRSLNGQLRGVGCRACDPSPFPLPLYHSKFPLPTPPLSFLPFGCVSVKFATTSHRQTLSRGGFAHSACSRRAKNQSLVSLDRNPPQNRPTSEPLKTQRAHVKWYSCVSQGSTTGLSLSKWRDQGHVARWPSRCSRKPSPLLSTQSRCNKKKGGSDAPKCTSRGPVIRLLLAWFGGAKAMCAQRTIHTPGHTFPAPIRIHLHSSHNHSHPSPHHLPPQKDTSCIHSLQCRIHSHPSRIHPQPSHIHPFP